MKTPQPETCNGLDDDCDGKVDELTSAADRTTDDKIVYFAAKNVTVFAYEATRYDANATSAGVVSNHRPCSVPSKLPWANVTADEAAAACAMIGTGWRLCTTAEWTDICNGPSNTAFPYGAAYNGTRLRRLRLHDAGADGAQGHGHRHDVRLGRQPPGRQQRL